MFEKSIIAIHHKIQNLIKTWVLPFTCIFCRNLSDHKQDLCSACLEDLPIITQSCPRCANKTHSGLLCGNCLKNPPPFSSAYALFAYEQPVTTMILNLKFKQQLAYGRILGELLAEKIKADWYRSKSLPDLIMPVPLHEQRLQERGFNQALELARPLAAALHLNIDTRAVRRIKNTPAQMKLAAASRQSNMKNAFIVDKQLNGKTIAVLDDVMTTGSTVRELSRVLLQQGKAKGVEVWCCARA